MWRNKGVHPSPQNLTSQKVPTEDAWNRILEFAGDSRQRKSYNPTVLRNVTMAGSRCVLLNQTPEAWTP